MVSTAVRDAYACQGDGYLRHKNALPAGKMVFAMSNAFTANLCGIIQKGRIYASQSVQDAFNNYPCIMGHYTIFLVANLYVTNGEYM